MLCRISYNNLSIVLLARVVSPASDFTSAATTANPCPATPARAASMVAFSASRSVLRAMLRMSSSRVAMRTARSSSTAIVATL